MRHAGPVGRMIFIMQARPSGYARRGITLLHSAYATLFRAEAGVRKAYSYTRFVRVLKTCLRHAGAYP